MNEIKVRLDQLEAAASASASASASAERNRVPPLSASSSSDGDVVRWLQNMNTQPSAIPQQR